MIILTITVYVLAILFLFFLTKAVIKVLPFYWPAFGRFQVKVISLRITFLKWLYKKRGYQEYFFNKGKFKFVVMAKSRKEAYTKFKTHTKSNRKN
jgi:hypothetical protein